MQAITLSQPVTREPATDAFAIGGYGLIVTGKPTYEQWVQVGRNLWTQKQKIQWNIGDWINHGEACYGEKYVQALRETDYTLQTLENYASVARKVPVEQRRKNISFSMYQEVAPLPLPERETLLDGVELGIVSRQDVRDYKRERREKAQSVGTTASVTNDQTITLQCKGFTVKNGMLAVTFVAPSEVFEIVGYQAIVRKRESLPHAGSDSLQGAA
jgi:hypothetical protein